MRRFLGLVLMPIGLVLFIASACSYLFAIADYFDIADLWSLSCPGPFRTKALLIGGVVVAVLGQRLYTGRNLRTGAKPENES